MSEGFGSSVFSGNVFEIMEHWSTTVVKSNTHTHFYKVLAALRHEVICFYFISGSVDAQRTNFDGPFDYSVGDCDNQATFTFNNGQEIDLTLY
jgi:hypothetical protein